MGWLFLPLESLPDPLKHLIPDVELPIEETKAGLFAAISDFIRIFIDVFGKVVSIFIDSFKKGGRF